MGCISYFSIKEISYKTLLLGSTSEWYIVIPNNHLRTIISNTMSSVISDHDEGASVTDINTHKSMVFIAKHATILSDNGNKVDVSPFTPYYQSIEKVSILEVSTQYTCQYMAKEYILVFRNSLTAPIIDKKLVPKIIIREAGQVFKGAVKSMPWIYLWSIREYILPTSTFTLRCLFMVHSHTSLPLSHHSRSLKKWIRYTS